MTHSPVAHVPLFCFYHILMSSVIYYWTDARKNGIYLLNGHHAPVNDAKEFPKAYHLSGLQFLLDVYCYCPGFTGIQQYWDYQGVHKSDLWAKRDYYAYHSRWSSVLLVLLSSVQILVSTSSLEPWSWRLRPDTWNCPLINLVQFFTDEKPITFNLAILFLFIWSIDDIVACFYVFLLSLHFCS